MAQFWLCCVNPWGTMNPAHMNSIKDLKLAQKSAAEQMALVSELNNVLRDIERCERTITKLKDDLEKLNAKHAGPRTTRDDIAYLTGLLDCTKQKLTWEKQLASVQKRTPTALERLTKLINDPKNPPAEETRDEMLRVLQAIQAAMDRLQKLSV